MSLAAKLGQIKDETIATEQRSAELQETIQVMREESYTLGQELGEAQRKLKLKQMELDKVRRLLGGIEHRFDGLQENKSAALVANAEMQAVNDEREELFDEAKLTKDALYELESNVKQLESKKKVIYSNINKAESRMVLLKSKRDILFAQIDELNSTIKEADHSANLDFSEEDLMAKVRELDAEILRVSVERENFQRKVASIKASEVKIDKLIASVNNELHAIEAEVDGLNSLA